jgi:hypothetical protein
MAAVAPTFLSVLLLLGLGGLGMPSDLLSLIDPDAYFRAREVPVTVAKMLELAGKEPSDAKGEVAQLLAIHMLGEEPDEVQKDKEGIVKVLQPLAQGKQAGDKHGFVRSYARRTLGRLGVKIGQNAEPGAQRQLIDTFNWFPDKTTFVAGGWNAARDDSKDNPLRAMLKANGRPEDLEQLYKFAETVGNVRLDGFTLGYAFEAQQPQKGRIYIHIRGAADHERLVAFLRKTGGQVATFKEEKGPGGERITFMTQNFGPAMALVGDTDLIVGAKADQPTSDTTVVEQMLKIRAGEQPNLLKGALGDDLKKISPNAVGLMLGDVPQEVRQMILAVGPFRAFPDRLQVELTRGGNRNLDVHFRAKLGNANEAKLLADDVGDLRKKGIEALKNPPPLPPEIKLPPRTFELMRATLESLKLEAKESAVTGKMEVARELVNVLPMMFISAAAFRPNVPMPPNPPKAVPAPGK